MPLRGGDWDLGERAGVFAFDVAFARSLSYPDIGVRAALFF